MQSNQYQSTTNQRQTLLRLSDPSKNIVKAPVKKIQVKKTGTFIGALTIINTMIGAGIVAMPYAGYYVGLFPNILLNIISAALAQLSIILLLSSKRLSGYNSYSEIGFKSYGRASIFLINGAIAFAYIGIQITYFTIFADNMTNLLKHFNIDKDSVILRRDLLISILALLLTYFILQKQIAQIKLTSIFAFTAISTFIIILIIEFALGKTTTDDSTHKHDNLWFKQASIDIFVSLPIILLAYAFQPSFFPVYESLKHKNQKNGYILIFIALSICTVVYLTVSFVGIYAYEGDVKDNVLLNLDTMNNVPAYLLQAFFIVISAMHIPVVFFIGKESVLIMIDECRNKSISSEQLRKIQKSIKQTLIRGSFLKQQKSLSSSAIFDGRQSNRIGGQSKQNIDDQSKASYISVSKPPAYLQMNNWIYYIVTLFIWLAVIGISILHPDLAFVLGLIGATAVSCFSYIFPGAFYVKLSWGKKQQSKCLKGMGFLYVIFGFSVMIGCNFCNIYLQVKG